MALSEQKFTGFLARLRKDKSGNTLAIIGAAMIPLMGLIGGSVDISRVYLAKTRLQQACDAGALAGRRAMGNTGWTTSGATSSQARANAMFDANFKTGSFGSANLSRTFTEASSTVTGTVSVSVPMTLMHMFGQTAKTLNVTCSSTMSLPNTDVMFVLDTTGSMNCVAGDTSCPNGNNNNVEATNGKIKGLRSAVLCFYEALKKVNTTEDCGFTPSGSQTAQIRFGFVPYAVNVNVGKLLPNDYLADSWNYQTRVSRWYQPGDQTTNDTWQVYSGGASIGQSDCQKWLSNTAPYNSGTYPNTTGTAPSPTVNQSLFDTDGDAAATAGNEWGWSGAPDSNGSNRSCRRRIRAVTTYNQVTFRDWSYQQASLNVSGLKAGGSNWNGTVTLPIGDNGTDRVVTWDGCIEERQTFQNTDGTYSDDWNPIPSTAYDMNMDMIPSSGVAGSQWGPMLNNVVYPRYSGWSATLSTFTSTGTPSLASYNCPSQAHKLSTFDTASTFETYVAGLKTGGSTYHDIGMIWGARLLSPTGIFASENATTSSGAPISRHIVFMTDGDTMAQNTHYTSYGVSWWDRRQATTVLTNGTNGSDGTMAEVVNSRLVAMCNAIKNRNITLHVVSYGGGINATTESRLESCATSGKYYTASNAASLITTFRQIADDISELRLTN